MQASLKELKVGDRVVIYAKPNAEKKLVGVTVKWGAASAAHPDQMKMK
jgi:predicted RNA-binding protein with PUA-like domain